MFLPCPNCGFLVALIPLRGNASQRCPRCGTALPRPDEIGGAPALVPASHQRDADTVEPLPAETTDAAGDDAPPGAPVQPEPARADASMPAPGPAMALPRREGGPSDAADQVDGMREGDSGRDAVEAAHSGAATVPPASDDSAPEPAFHDGIRSPAAPALQVDRTTEPEPAAVVEEAPAPRSAPLAFPLHDDSAAQAAADAATRLAASPRRASPSFARRARLRHAGRRGPLLAGIAVLALVLALQLLLAQRAELAADARWRPWVQATCGVLGCDVPAWHQPAAFAMVERSVQPRPGAPGVLAVRARFRNGASWAQEWPVVVLTLSDVNGGVLGARALRPAEYAPGARPATLAPGAEGSLAVDVAEPAPGVVAFGFDFR